MKSITGCQLIQVLLIAGSLMLAGCPKSTEPVETPQQQTESSESSNGNPKETKSREAEAVVGQADEWKNLDEPDSVMLFRKEVTLDSSQPTKITLEDGLKLEIPQQAIESENLIITKHQYAPADGYLLEEFEYYEFEAENHKLNKAVKFHFPLELSSDVEVANVRVLHQLDSGVVEELSGTYDTERKSFTVSTDSFSTFSKPLVPNAFDRVAQALASVTVEGVHLRPKYYSQFDHGWCWATSMAMMISSYGETVHPQEIAALYQSEKSDGFGMMPIFGYSLAPIQNHSAAKNLTLTPYRIGGMTENRIRGFLIQKLDEGKPVWMGLPNYKPDSDHVILVIGYRHNGFIIHDPSGALVAHLEETYQPDPAKRVNVYSNYFVPFDRWHKVVNPVRTQLVVVEKKLPEMGSTCSFQLPLRDTGIQFRRTGIVFANQREVYYFWNGEKEAGAGFSIDESDDRQKGLAGLSNSDYLRAFQVLTHNTGTEDKLCKAEVVLDGQTILKDQELQFPARQVNRLVPLYLPNPLIESEPMVPHQPYTEVSQRKNLQDGLNFNQFPLRLGKHNLVVKLWDELGQNQLDQVSFDFVMTPAMVPQPEVETKSGSSGDQVTHVVRFDHSPEASRQHSSILPGQYSNFGDSNQKQPSKPEVKIEYEVWQQISEGRLNRDPAIVARLDGSADGDPEVEVKIPRNLIKPGVSARYYVVAVDKVSGLSSPQSMTSRRQETLPETGPIRYRLTDVKYRIAPRVDGKFVPKIGSLKPGNQLRLNAGSFPPYELEYDLKIPTELLFEQLGVLEKNHQGKPIYREKNQACGLKSDAQFSLNRLIRVTQTNAKHTPKNFNEPDAMKKVYELQTTSEVIPYHYYVFVKAEMEETKPPAAKSQYRSEESKKRFFIPPSVTQAAFKNSLLNEKIAPQSDLMISDFVSHYVKSETPVEHTYEHVCITPKGSMAATTNSLSIPDLELYEKVKSSGGAIVVRIQSQVKSRFPLIVVDFYLIYRHEG